MEENCTQDCDSSKTPFRCCVLLKLFLVLLVSPLANLLTIILTIETEIFVTFQKSGFGGLRVGITTTKINVKDKFFVCRAFHTTIATNEIPISKFFRCSCSVLI